MALTIDTDVKYVKGVGQYRAQLFARLGVRNVGALLNYYPRAYEDWSCPLPIAEAPLEETVCVKAAVLGVPEVSNARSGMTLVKAAVSDGFSVLQLTFFHSEYVASQLIEGQEYLFLGKITENMFGGREMLAPQFLTARDNETLRPVYRQTDKLTSRVIAGAVKNALANCDTPEFLPVGLPEKYALPPLREALIKIHFPANYADVRTARRRLIFDELLIFQLGLLLVRRGARTGTDAKLERVYTDEFYDLLPYDPTRAQRQAVREALEDMASGSVMNRLLQGDVGSGKTVVAAALIYNAARNGLQSALMVPTEVLAEQHYRSLSGLFEGRRLAVALLTGSQTAAAKRRIKEKLKNGEIQCVIGTHALLQNDVAFQRLGLVITDEQHRFGVKQRANLAGKGENPHVYVMSATPIPRTLALIVYGDLDVSLLDELPPGRTPVQTYCVGSALRERVDRFIRLKLEEGRQVYVACPLIEEGETGAAGAGEVFERMKKVFPDYSVGLLHGQLKPAEKENIMRRFSQGEIRLLVCTVVIEVGVDVPNAALMVIENGERFGLSQLHQLRGRIGRGRHKSFCIVISDAQNEESVKRLQIFESTTDGFQIADEDLRLRGPGDFLGKRQHGLPEFRIADLAEDTKILTAARNIAAGILQDDENLTHPENARLRAAVDNMLQDIGNALS